MENAAAAVTRLKEIFDRYSARVVKRIDRYSSGEALVLKLICLACGPVHPSELREKACISSARVAAILRTLERKGFITREIDTTDRRKILVSITETGRVVAEEEIQKMEAQLAAVFKEMGTEDSEELIRLLERMFEVFVRLNDDSPDDNEGELVEVTSDRPALQATQEQGVDA
jgi:DNA-binding MarR family transcriptional regulator